jgi:VCBS repeat-containing protein
MRTISTLCLALIVLLNACKKDDEAKFASAEGNWTYTTSDGKISVDFTLVKSGTTWNVTNPVIRVDGTAGNAEVISSGVNPPAIQSIRINANDAKLTYDYSIEFDNATVNSDFTQITVPGGTYTWPIDKTNNLANITITRK